MISLSNVNKTETKVIEIRPLQKIKKEEKHQLKENKAIKKTSLQLEIEREKQKLHALENERKQRLQQLQIEIENEKQLWEQTKQEELKQIQEEGFNAGFSEGKNKSLTKYKHLIDEANDLVIKAKEQYFAQLQQTERTIVQLAMQTAKKILNQTIDEAPERFVPIVQKAIEQLKEDETYTIYLHPRNYETVLKQKAELYESLSESATILLYVDEDLEKNSCLIEHSSGKVDASVNTQLNEIKKILLNIAKKE